ncbi:cytochrome c oxidase assembly protein [Rhizobium sp. CNPSo 3464]|uniref:cytochrome c oxidase assembly protein n=1 Tax=Rhizobium sp. CNPSo 3464 TaxID=3021406 RepID=UPI00254F3889|nr:cytochrome c oxidase assembly protein [Rhizobium sp. CNPSo 3464]MDK4743678.1 cytochrome c oxidase assembly protein [Rhizobium sp. CNPSo 3464]
MALERMRTLGALMFLLMMARQAAAHGAEAHLFHSIWTIDPWIGTPLAIIAFLYGRGSWKLWRRTGRSRPVMAKRAICYWAGWLTLAGALLSPLHWLGEQVFTFHMIEHEIIMAVSAPMIVIARPAGLFLWGMPERLRRWTGRAMRRGTVRSVWRWLSGGTNATLLHAVAIWAWHAPALFDAAVDDVALHRLQHLSFFASAVLFWWSVFWCSNHGVAAWHLFLTMLHTGALGALMALAPRVLYVEQTHAAATWGLTPLEDQQLAGMVMWIPAGTIYAGAALVLAALWIANAGRGVDHVQRIRPL